MINIYSVIVGGAERPDSTSQLATKLHILKGRCRILLQVALGNFLPFIILLFFVKFLGEFEMWKKI